MTTLAELEETKSVLATMMTALSGTLVGTMGTNAANLRYGIADLLSNADYLIRSATLGTPLQALFNLAVLVGASIVTFELVRSALTALTPTTPYATALTNIGIQMVLACEVQTYSQTTFTSRQDVDAAILQLNSAFGPAQEFAADNQDPTSFQALIAAQAAAVRDLTTRGSTLANMVRYKVGRVMTSHALAQRLYGDASRCDQLVAENKTIDPHFMQLSGLALAE